MSTASEMAAPGCLFKRLIAALSAVVARPLLPSAPDLQRFLEAQSDEYAAARAQLEIGRKDGHWMWFMFPNLDGLGKSIYARKYAIHNIEEAQAYLSHPVLGARLIRLSEILLNHRDKSAFEIFGTPDDLKLRSCMTLFAGISAETTVFRSVLDRFYSGEECAFTQAAINSALRRG